MKRQRFLMILLVVGSFLTAFNNCSQVAFETSESLSSKAGENGGNSEAILCDPFDQSNVISPVSGLQGSLYYLDQDQPRYTTSADYITHGHKVNVELFLNKIYVPTREFTYGFSTEGGSTLRNEQGETLIEYFGMSLTSRLRLGPNDQTGTYEMAIISDDGAVLKVSDSSGQLVPFINNDGQHAPRMGCSESTIEMTPETRLPISLTYFQGPRVHIALVLMWRKIDDGVTRDTSECGKKGSEHFFKFKSGTGTSEPQASYESLLDNGWKPLGAENFELVSGVNKCTSK